MRWVLAAVLPLTACVTGGAVTATPAGTTAGVSVGVGVSGGFYSELSPYGQWLQASAYGQCWQPYQNVVGYDFQPYLTGGNWVWTDAGWQFESNYPFAWATYHYGRWLEDPSAGWCWVPGDEWAPAWVTWRYGAGYIGWAPLPPGGVSVPAPPAWSFVDTRHFVAPDVYRYRMGDRQRVYWMTRPVAPPAGRQWSPGPPPQNVASVIGRPVPTAPPVRGRPPPGGAMRPGVPPPVMERGERPERPEVRPGQPPVMAPPAAPAPGVPPQGPVATPPPAAPIEPPRVRPGPPWRGPPAALAPANPPAPGERGRSEPPAGPPPEAAPGSPPPGHGPPPDVTPPSPHEPGAVKAAPPAPRRGQPPPREEREERGHGRRPHERD